MQFILLAGIVLSRSRGIPLPFQGKSCRCVRDPGRRSLHSLALGWYPSPLQGEDHVRLGVIHLPIVNLCGDEFVRPRIERLWIEAGSETRPPLPILVHSKTIWNQFRQAKLVGIPRLSHLARSGLVVSGIHPHCGRATLQSNSGDIKESYSSPQWMRKQTLRPNADGTRPVPLP